MNTTAHNHPPRCCCGVPPIAADDQTATPCPLCIEHGELAQLAENREYPGQPGEKVMPCCHQLAGRPHTDYCPTRTEAAQPQPTPAPPASGSWASQHTHETGHHTTETLTNPGSCDDCGQRSPAWELKARAHVQAGYPAPTPKTPTPPIDSWPDVTIADEVAARAANAPRAEYISGGGGGGYEQRTYTPTRAEQRTRGWCASCCQDLDKTPPPDCSTPLLHDQAR